MKKEIQTRLLIMLIGISGATAAMCATILNSHYSETTYRNLNLPAPKLFTLEVFKNGGKVEAFWSASNESGDDYYTLERSKNGINFEAVSRIDMANTSTNVIQYIETDYQPLKGISYYRLKCTDSRKNTAYSNIARVNYNIDKSGIPGIKQPNSDKIINALKQLPPTEDLVVLRDNNGKEFYSKVLISVENCDIVGYDTSNKLPSGTYLITGTSNNILYGQKLIVRDAIVSEL
jgi:hypothetical protein